MAQMNIEVFKIIYKLSERFKNDEDRYWKLIVELFVVEGVQSIQLGNLAPKFEAYYLRKAKYTGKMRSLVSSPEFQKICKIVQIDSTVNIEPSDTIKIITQGLSSAGSATDIAQNRSLYDNNVSNITKNNTNVENYQQGEKVHESFVPVDLDAVATIRSRDINPNNPFLEKARHLEDDKGTNNTNVMLPNAQNNPFMPLAEVEQKILSKLESQKYEIQPNNMNNINVLNNIHEDKEIKSDDSHNESERFGSMVLEELTCLFCYGVLQQAVESSCCKALCCSGCTEKMIKMRKVRNSCPVCRAQEISWIPNEPIRRILSKKPTKCDIDGCDTWSTLDEISQHKITCEYRLIDCENTENGCDSKMIAKLLAEHLITCQFKIVPCSYCKVKIIRREQNLHENCCHLKPVQCKLCQQYFIQPLLKNHMANCDHRKTKCKNGCKDMIYIKDLQKHETEDCERRRIHCPNQGCSVRDYVPKIESHLLECSHRVIPCTNKGCNCLMKATKLKDHAKSCKFRIVPCQNKECDEKNIPWNGMQRHLTECRYRNVKCMHNNCTVNVALAYVKDHEKQCQWKPRKCPNGCGVKLLESEVLSHLPRCARRKIACTNEGCNAQVTLSDLPQHIAEKCLFTVIKCTNEGCGEGLKRLDFDMHIKSCLFRKLPCSHVGCEQMLVTTELSAHEENCPYRKYKCPNVGCNQQFKQKELYVHVKSCQFKQQSCPNEGCPFKGLDAELPKHARTCKYREAKCRHKGCGASVKKIELEKHQEECQYALWNCRIDGCSVVVKKMDLYDHESTCSFKLKQ